MSSAGVCSCGFENAHFIGCNMEKIAAEESNFSGAVFEECGLQQSHLAHSNFTNAQFTGTGLWMVDMRNCCIESVRIPDTEAQGIDLNGASENAREWAEGPRLEMGGMS